MRFVTFTLHGSVQNFSCSWQCKKVTFTQHINELQMYCIIGLLKLILKVKGIINSLVPTSFNHNVSQNSNKECLHFSATVIIVLRYLMVKIFFSGCHFCWDAERV